MEPSRKTVVNRDLDSYISRVRRKSVRESLTGLFKREKKAKEEQEDTEIVSDEEFSIAMKKNYSSPSWYSRFIGVFKPKEESSTFKEQAAGFEGDIDSVSDEEFEKELNELEEVETKQEKSLGFLGFIKKLNFFSKQGDPGYDVPGEEDLEKADSQAITKIVLERPEVEKDMKKIALVTQTILQNLPEEKLQEFKKSDDFLIYKDVLSKYDLIKK